ncbi:conserved protein of unknown function [Rhodovastum atsumiense]|uniref:Uncharacterized protein n=1 Tax=Rhodovastum atsumiense TaxID=504468 RepID=A0A5M6IZT4_9PROT|nr:hypothetical protein [Rhodovastum atsumiense]KAA5613489.1 hypothetical protein F1189_05385 [Rhodovastum atsumiense]CAH2603233.1 conserved protein of unknown function [Rhodovastum atsumiense]
MWACIEDGMVRELTATDPAGRFHPSLLWVACDAAVREGWRWDGTGFAAPAAAGPDLAAAARLALRASDIAVLRCAEHGVAVPAVWLTYREALRAIAAGTTTVATLPERPEYPPGT